MTACGMAAVTTVLAWLREEGALAGGVVAGRRRVPRDQGAARTRPRPAAGHGRRDQRRALGGAIDRHAPGAVFLDSIGNSSGVPVPDLDAVIRRLSATGRDAWLVVDNSGASPLSQPLARAPRRLGRLRIVAVESLTKYAQLGLDRTTAGMITAAGAGTERLSEHRERLGTNVLDVSVHTSALARSPGAEPPSEPDRAQRDAPGRAPPQRLRPHGAGVAPHAAPPPRLRAPARVPRRLPHHRPLPRQPRRDRGALRQACDRARRGGGRAARGGHELRSRRDPCVRAASGLEGTRRCAAGRAGGFRNARGGFCASRPAPRTAWRSRPWRRRSWTPRGSWAAGRSRGRPPARSARPRGAARTVRN